MEKTEVLKTPESKKEKKRTPSSDPTKRPKTYFYFLLNKCNAEDVEHLKTW